ncbi:unnamed protein product [Prorocentrum cordatum]|uniref:Uncharacterized protein n=1 Tax=Prorocentrum cordatum TaxID=2364126 RepID=A0ABN9UQC8_9DINO|nr:unnamed protein product [Polarella glacialis]
MVQIYRASNLRTVTECLTSLNVDGDNITTELAAALQHASITVPPGLATATFSVGTPVSKDVAIPAARWEVRNDWSLCSTKCGVGVQTRRVHCFLGFNELCNFNPLPNYTQGSFMPDRRGCEMYRSWPYDRTCPSGPDPVTGKGRAPLGGCDGLAADEHRAALPPPCRSRERPEPGAGARSSAAPLLGRRRPPAAGPGEERARCSRGTPRGPAAAPREALTTATRPTPTARARRPRARAASRRAGRSSCSASGRRWPWSRGFTSCSWLPGWTPGPRSAAVVALVLAVCAAGSGVLAGRAAALALLDDKDRGPAWGWRPGTWRSSLADPRCRRSRQRRGRWRGERGAQGSMEPRPRRGRRPDVVDAGRGCGRRAAAPRGAVLAPAAAGAPAGVPRDQPVLRPAQALRPRPRVPAGRRPPRRRRRRERRRRRRARRPRLDGMSEDTGLVVPAKPPAEPPAPAPTEPAEADMRPCGAPAPAPTSAQEAGGAEPGPAGVSMPFFAPGQFPAMNVWTLRRREEQPDMLAPAGRSTSSSSSSSSSSAPPPQRLLRQPPRPSAGAPARGLAALEAAQGFYDSLDPAVGIGGTSAACRRLREVCARPRGWSVDEETACVCSAHWEPTNVSGSPFDSSDGILSGHAAPQRHAEVAGGAYCGDWSAGAHESWCFVRRGQRCGGAEVHQCLAGGGGVLTRSWYDREGYGKNGYEDR